MVLNMIVYSHSIIDTLSDVSDAAMSVEGLVMDARPDSPMMLLAGGVIGPFTRFVIGESSARGILATRVDTLTGVCMSMVAVVDITLEDIEAASCATDVWTGTIFETVMCIVTWDDVVATSLIDLFADRVSSTESDIGVSADVWESIMTTLEFVARVVSTEKLLLCCGISFRC